MKCKKSFIFLIFVLLLVNMFFVSFVRAEIQYNLTYDDNGNLIENYEVYYGYHGFDELKVVRENNETGRIIAEYFYDQKGNRILKQEFFSSGTMNFTGLNFGTNNFLDLEFSDCQTLIGSYFQARANGGQWNNFTDCSLAGYSVSGNLTAASVEINFVSGSYDFSSPIAFGNLTLNSY